MRPRREDAAAIFARYSSDPEVTRYVSFPRHTSPADPEAFIGRADDEWTRAGCGAFLAWSCATGELLGGTGLEASHGASVETGYVLAKDAWGQGYATEMLRAMVTLARDVGIHRLVAHCHVDHHRSVRVLEKCGFTVAAIVPAVRFPNLVPPEAPAFRYERDAAGKPELV